MYFLVVFQWRFPPLAVGEAAADVELVQVDEVAFEEDGAKLLDCHCLGLTVFAEGVDQQVEFVLLEVRGFPHGEDDLEDGDG